MKTELEIKNKLNQMLAIDCKQPPIEKLVFSKAAACKALLWALGENDDDCWHITARPGPPIPVHSHEPK